MIESLPLENTVNTVIESENIENKGKDVVLNDPTDVPCGSHLTSYKDLTGFPLFPQGTESSLLAKYLTREIWADYGSDVTNNGFSFKQFIFSGC